MDNDVLFGRLDAKINAAWASVRTARAAWARSPNAITLDAEKQAYRTLDDLLELRYAAQTRHPTPA